MVTSLIRELDRQPGAPAVARGCVRDLFGGLGEGDRRGAWVLAPDVELVVSELVTNAVRYGSGAITLRVRVLGGVVTVGVHDGGSELPQVEGPAPSAEGGRGMVVVLGLASDWGVRSDGESGKEVWAILVADSGMADSLSRSSVSAG